MITITNKTLVLGVGSIIRQDDGIGPKVIQELTKQGRLNVDLVDGGTDGLALLDLLEQYDQAIIIDAVDMGLAAGTIREFTPNDAKININHDALSTHGFGLAEVIKLMTELEIKTAITIIGVQPKDISFGEELTDEVAASIEPVISKIKKRVGQVLT